MEDTYVIRHIKELCRQRHVSYYRLSKLSDIPYSSLNTMLKKEHIPSMRNLIKICNGLNITLTQFFSETSDNLTSEQQTILELWSLLDPNTKQFLLGYMYGITHKELPPSGDKT